MTTTERLSGAESAARIIGRAKWQDPCGFGTCAGHIDCRDKHCPEHPCNTEMLGLPVIDPKFFEEQKVTALIREGQFRRNDLPIQFAEEETTDLIESVKRGAFWLKWLACAIGGGLLIAAVIHASTK